MNYIALQVDLVNCIIMIAKVLKKKHLYIINTQSVRPPGTKYTYHIIPIKCTKKKCPAEV